MLDKIFTNDGTFEQVETIGFLYYDCTLVRAIGDYPIGYKLPQIFINCATGEMGFWENGNEFASFDLELTVKETVNAKQLLIDFNNIIPFSDLIYSVRDDEGLNWDGPKVAIWGKLCDKFDKLIKE